MIYNYEGFLDRIIDSKASKIAMNTVKRKKGAEKYVKRWKVLEALLRPPAFFQHVRLCDLHSVKKTRDGVNQEGRRGRGRRGLESSGRGRSWSQAPPASWQLGASPAGDPRVGARPGPDGRREGGDGSHGRPPSAQPAAGPGTDSGGRGATSANIPLSALQKPGFRE